MGYGAWLAAMGVLVLVFGQPSGGRTETFKVAVVDQQAVLEQSKAGKRAMESLKEFSASRQRIIAVDDEEMKRLEKELKDQDPNLSEAAKREKQRVFQTKLESYQRRLQEFNREIQEKQKEMGDNYLRKVKEVAAEIAQKEGYAAVLDKGSDSTLKIVIYHRGAIDLTDRVMKEFDKRYP
jgi:outer membrane protein